MTPNNEILLRLLSLRGIPWRKLLVTMLSCHRKKLEFISITISQGSLYRATSISIQDHLQGKANRPVGHIFIKSQHLPETTTSLSNYIYTEVARQMLSKYQNSSSLKCSNYCQQPRHVGEQSWKLFLPQSSLQMMHPQPRPWQTPCERPWARTAQRGHLHKPDHQTLCNTIIVCCFKLQNFEVIWPTAKDK